MKTPPPEALLSRMWLSDSPGDYRVSNDKKSEVWHVNDRVVRVQSPWQRIGKYNWLLTPPRQFLGVVRRITLQYDAKCPHCGVSIHAKSLDTSHYNAFFTCSTCADAYISSCSLQQIGVYRLRDGDGATPSQAYSCLLFSIAKEGA